jgi:hypothetical protein
VEGAGSVCTISVCVLVGEAMAGAAGDVGVAPDTAGDAWLPKLVLYGRVISVKSLKLAAA